MKILDFIQKNVRLITGGLAGVVFLCAIVVLKNPTPKTTLDLTEKQSKEILKWTQKNYEKNTKNIDTMDVLALQRALDSLFTR